MRCLTKSFVVVLSVACFSAGAVNAQEKVSTSPARPIDPAQIREALQPLLKIAADGDKTAPDQIEQKLKTLLIKTDNDPRLHYVHALALLKNFRHSDATRAMQAASDHRLYYFPVHHFLIYEQIRLKQFDVAVDNLVDLAERIGDPSQLWTSEEDRLQAAHWLGRAMTFLEGPAANPSAAKMMSQAEQAIRARVGPVYETEINRGVDELHAEHRETQMLLLAAVDTAGQKKVEALKESEQKQLEIDAKKKQLATSERAQEEIAEEQLKEIDSQLAAMEKQFIVLKKTGEQLVLTILEVRQEIALLPTLASALNSNRRSSNSIATPGQIRTANLSTNDLEAAIAIKNLELQGYLLELQKNSTQQAETLRRAEATLRQRGRVVSSMNSSGAMTQESQRKLSAWERRIQTTRTKSHQITDRRTGTIRARISLISSYDSLNIPDELAELEHSLADEAVNP